MKDFMKTITSAIKCWTTAKIKNSTADWNEKDVNKDSYIKNKPDVALRKEVDAIQNAIDYKMNNSNPVGTGSFSMNRLPNSEIGDYSHAEGIDTEASAYSSHAEGSNTVASGVNSHAEGSNTVATGGESHAEGNYTNAIGNGSHAEGCYAKASGNYSHAEGYSTEASDHSSHAEGYYTKASGDYSHAEGYYTVASEHSSHAEGYYTVASEHSSHAEGYDTVASGSSSHAEGNHTIASRGSSHAEGIYTEASGMSSHAEGNYTKASGDYSHAEGYYTKASGDYQHVQGKYNVSDVDSEGNPLNNYAHIVGNGVSYSKRSNAHTLDWEGNAWFSGDVYTGSTSGTNRDEGSKKLASEEYVDESIASTVAVKVFPISETYTSGIFTFARTNIFELTQNQVYSTISVDGIDGWYISVPCTDGTFKNICLLGAGCDYRILYDETKANVYSFKENVYFLADYTDRSTSSVVTINKTKNYYYLNVNNTTEYTPTSNYHPATKKYVDDSVSNIDLSTYETTANAQLKLDEAKSYADTAAITVKNDLLNGAGAAYDTLKELGDLIDTNVDAIDALETVASGKADKVHKHDDMYYTEVEIDEFLVSKQDKNFVITLSGNDTDGYIADKTYAEVAQAYNDGRNCILIDTDNSILTLTGVTSLYIVFVIPPLSSARQVMITSANKVIYKRSKLLKDAVYSNLTTTDKTIVGAINELSETVQDMLDEIASRNYLTTDDMQAYVKEQISLIENGNEVAY